MALSNSYRDAAVCPMVLATPDTCSDFGNRFRISPPTEYNRPASPLARAATKVPRRACSPRSESSYRSAKASSTSMPPGCSPDAARLRSSSIRRSAALTMGAISDFTPASKGLSAARKRWPTRMSPGMSLEVL
ncbi:MAG: hypothetical protein JRI25_29610 [Deltaproteobacteria bacterium]|nr:hypothetical protein [Deltaproteobacteria bacterium]